jgi:hypothetical protein
MANQARDALETEAITVVADRCYFKGEESVISEKITRLQSAQSKTLL